MSVTVQELLRDALLEIAVIDPLDPIPPEMLDLALLRCNSILNLWNAQQIATYNVDFSTFSTTSGLSPHTIGLAANSPTWTVTTNRPVSILGANRIIGTGTSLVKIPITLVDDAWWLKQSVPNIQTSIPTQLYFSPGWPNGSVYLWPVPNAVFTIELELRTVMAEFASGGLSSDFSMPPGYQRALTLTLAKDLTGPLPVSWSTDQEQKLTAATAIIFANNNPPVRIRTRQSGMMSRRGGMSGAFNWRSRQPSGS